jgi:hypothetical protein
MPRIRPATRLGWNGLDRVDRLADSGELDRLAGDGAHRQGRAAAGVAVEASENDSGHRHLLGEARRDVDRVLAGQRVDDEQYLVRRGDFGDRLHLVHQRLVDVEAAGGVEDEDVIALKLCRLEGAPGDVDRLLAGDDRKGGDLGLLAEHPQLLLRRRPGDVERGHHHLLAGLLLQPLGDLGAGRRLARALKADHHHHRRRSDVDMKLGRIGAEHVDEGVVDDLDDLLAGRDRLQDLLADRGFRHLVDEVAHDRQGDVGFEQGDPNLAHRAANVRLVERAAAAQAVEHAGKAVAQAVEHALTPSCPAQTHKAPAGETRRPACGASPSRDVGAHSGGGKGWNPRTTLACNEADFRQHSGVTAGGASMVVRREISDRTLVGKIFKWLFIIFNAIMLIALVRGCSATNEVMMNAQSEAERAGAGLGTVLGIGMLLTLWVFGDIILGLFVLFTRRKKIIEVEE